MSTQQPDLPAGPSTLPDGGPVAYQAVRGGLWVLVCSYWNIGWGFLANIVLMRQLTSEAYGVFALALFFAQLLRVQPKLGLGFAFAQQRENTGELLGSYVPTEVVLALAGLALSVLSVPVLAILGYEPVVAQVSVVLAIAFVAEGLAGIAFTLCDKELLFTPSSVVQSVALTISYVPAFWLAAQGAGVWCLVAQTLLYNGILLASILAVAYRRLAYLRSVTWRFSLERVRRLVVYGIKVGAAMFTGTLLTQLDNLMIGTFVGTSTLGYYDRAYRTTQWPSTLLTSLVARVGFFTYARLQDDRERLAKTVTMLVWAISMLAFPLALALYVSAPDLILWLYTATWLPSAPFMRILLVYSVVRPLADNAGALFIATGRPSIMTRYAAVQVGVLATVGLAMTLVWGAYGTAVAVAVVYALGFGLAYRHVSQMLSFSTLRVVGPSALISALILIVYSALEGSLAMEGLAEPVRVLVKGGAVTCAFVVLTVLAQPASTRERVAYVWRLLRQSAPSPA